MLDPDFASLLVGGDSMFGQTSLPPEDAIRLLAFYLMSFKVYEDAYYQFTQGSLDPKLWKAWEASLSGQLTGLAGMSLAWRSGLGRSFHEDFQTLVDGLLSTR